MTSFLSANVGLESFMSQKTTTAVVPTGPIEDVKDEIIADERGRSNRVEEKGVPETTLLANNSHSNSRDFHEEKTLSSIKTEKPATHIQSDRLEGQAAAAALYATKDDSGMSSGRNNKTNYDILDSNHKLSSAGAAASLKYAQPRDLPSYPSAGLKKDDSAAGAAASLGWANQKPFEHWKPEQSSSAFAAAMRAKDYKMAPSWQPEDSAHGAKAALLAHKNVGKVEIWKPEPTTWGNSAATQAMGRKNTLSPQLDYGYTDLGRKGSLMAATGAMFNSRRRADSTPIPASNVEAYPDERNAAANALSAATSAHKSKRKANVSAEGGSVPFTTMPKEMFTSHPPVAPEVEEQNRQDMLRASAIAMAKQMYNHQQKQFDQTAIHGATAAHGRRPSSSAGSEDAQPMRFNNLQEAAQKLAQERLAKLHDEHAKNREYRDYYGHSTQPASRLSIRGRTRRRASSDGNLDEDKEQSNKIRAQMSLFSSNLSQVDEKKRKSDREALIAAAQRNVTKSLHGMDEKVFADTGKVAPSLMSDWELKAHAAAQAKSDIRMENFGKVHIGGGKFINQSAVDLVASRNVQPVLDEINEKAEIERIRQAELKADQENEKRKAAEKKAREKESKDIHKKLKQQDKDEEKLKRQEEKAARDEEKRAEKEKRKSAKVEAIPVTGAKTEPATTTTKTATTSNDIEITDKVTSSTPMEPKPSNTIAERREVASTPADIRTSLEDSASQRMRELSDAADRDQTTITSPMSPNSPRDGGKVKNWLKTKFASRLSKVQKPTKETETSSSGFIGGAALTGASVSNSSLGGNSASVRDVALASSSSAARPQNSAVTNEERGGKVEKRASMASSVSSVSRVTRDDGSADGDGDGDEEFQEARDNFDEDLAPPPTFPVQKSSSPARCAKFTEVI